ncbi:MAG: hypothetical protein NT090_25970, partial [Acidobacteria bacterium]|nr:hypothetical protein [Acidobacteriota bacterium]
CEAAGSALAIALETAGGRLTLGVPLRDASPAVFVDRDGAPMVLDADRGLQLDAMTPARSESRIQILATGLGRVQTEWPTGLAAPLESPPGGWPRRGFAWTAWKPAASPATPWGRPFGLP